MILREGLTEIEVPGDEISKGPGTKRAGFYNPDQVLNRDLTLSLISVLGVRNYLDGFGGTGIRGIRVASETPAKAVIAEINTRSAEIIRQNVVRNGVDVQVYNQPFESVVSQRLFDFIDVDPYGSIVPFLDVALTHVKNNGYIGLTATDLSALTGSAPKKTSRRYSASILNDRLRHESGIRLMIAYIARRAAALDREITPLVSFWKSHYYRVIVKVKHGAGLADRMLEKIRLVDRQEINSVIYPHREEGPIWTGPLNREGEIGEMLKNRLPGVMERAYDFVSSLPHENEMLFFFELSDFAAHIGRSLPGIEKMCGHIQEEFSVPAYRTHFSDTGVKSRISGDDFYRIFEKHSVV